MCNWEPRRKEKGWKNIWRHITTKRIQNMPKIIVLIDFWQWSNSVGKRKFLTIVLGQLDIYIGKNEPQTLTLAYKAISS